VGVVNLTITVLDKEKGTPIPGAKVTVTSFHVTKKTDSNGKASFRLSVNYPISTTVVASHPQYHYGVKAVRLLPSDTSVEETISLRKKEAPKREKEEKPTPSPSSVFTKVIIKVVEAGTGKPIPDVGVITYLAYKEWGWGGRRRTDREGRVIYYFRNLRGTLTDVVVVPDEPTPSSIAVWNNIKYETKAVKIRITAGKENTIVIPLRRTRAPPHFRTVMFVRDMQGYPASRVRIVSKKLRKTFTTDSDGIVILSYDPKLFYVCGPTGCSYSGCDLVTVESEKYGSVDRQVCAHDRFVTVTLGTVALPPPGVPTAPPEIKGKLAVKVVDKRTGKPVPNALVRVFYDLTRGIPGKEPVPLLADIRSYRPKYKELGSKRTDSNGLAVFDVSHIISYIANDWREKRQFPGQSSLQASFTAVAGADGYMASDGYCAIGLNDTSASITVKLKNTTQQAVIRWNVIDVYTHKGLEGFKLELTGTASGRKYVFGKPGEYMILVSNPKMSYKMCNLPVGACMVCETYRMTLYYKDKTVPSNAIAFISTSHGTSKWTGKWTFYESEAVTYPQNDITIAVHGEKLGIPVHEVTAPALLEIDRVEYPPEVQKGEKVKITVYVRALMSGMGWVKIEVPGKLPVTRKLHFTKGMHQVIFTTTLYREGEQKIRITVGH